MDEIVQVAGSVRPYTTKQMGDACEMLIAAELTLAGGEDIDLELAVRQLGDRPRKELAVAVERIERVGKAGGEPPADRWRLLCKRRGGKRSTGRGPTGHDPGLQQKLTTVHMSSRHETF